MKKILIPVIIGIVAALLWYGKTDYQKKKSTITEGIASLPSFDSESAIQKVAKEANIKLPPKKPVIKKESIIAKAENDAKRLTKIKYSPRMFASMESKILKKYSTVKNGQTVSFYLSTTGSTIKGEFKGLFKDWKGRYVKVGYKTYRMPDITEEDRYKFITEYADKIRREKIKNLKTQFDQKRDDYFHKKRDQLLAKYYKTAGYSSYSGNWIPNYEFLDILLEKEKKSFDANQKKVIAKLIEDNKFLGLISIPIKTEKVDASVKKEDTKKVLPAPTKVDQKYF